MESKADTKVRIPKTLVMSGRTVVITYTRKMAIYIYRMDGLNK